MFGTTAHELKKLLINRKYALGFLAFVTVTVIAASTLLSIKTVTVNDGGNIYTVKSGDSLYSIAKKFNTSFLES